MSDSLEQPKCEIAHLVCNEEKLKTTRGVKYIVTHENDLYQLFADEGHVAHIGIFYRMEQEGKITDEKKIIGGGKVRISRTIPPKVELFEYSQQYGVEPAAVRAVFRSLLIVKLKEMGIETE